MIFPMKTKVSSHDFKRTIAVSFEYINCFIYRTFDPNDNKVTRDKTTNINKEF